MATTKKEIREFIRRAREDIQKLTQALASNKPRQIAIYLNDAEGSLDEVRALIEEKYGDAFLEAEEDLFGEEEEDEESEEDDEEDD